MAGSSLLSLLDDITSLLDDVAVLTKASAHKTAGVLGDDLALNAQQVTGVRADRELAVVWAVAKGSARNKAILVPAALALSAWMHWAIHPLLMLGGAFLCFEGAEKLLHAKTKPRDDAASEAPPSDAAAAETVTSDASIEQDKIRGAVRTDFVLSAEIVAITLGEVAQSPFKTQALVLVGISLLMTVGVYGFVAAIVKLDDAGLYALRSPRRWVKLVGKGLLVATPWLMRGLSVAGTAAMFLVGGGILAHGVAPLEHALASQAGAWSGQGGVFPLLAALVGPAVHGLVGLAAGVLLALALTLVQRLRGRAGLRGAAG